MALSLIGLDERAKRVYSWIGDPSCDVKASAVGAWLDNGTGLVALDGQEMTVFTCEPLSPTTREIVYGAAHGDVGNMAVVHRWAVAYGVVSIEHGPSLRRVQGPGGLRLHDELLKTLDSLSVELKSAEGSTKVSLFSHLGSLILADSEPSQAEKKVFELPCTPEK